LQLLPSKTQPVYKNRAGWAHDRLKRAGLSTSPRRGFWKLTEEGIAYAKSHPQPLSNNEVRKLSVVDPTIRLRAPVENQDQTEIADAAWATPDDALEAALTDLEELAIEDLLETMSHSSPKFFEMLVLDLLHAMGYGASRADLQHVGRSGDGGIDGIISWIASDLKKYSCKRSGGKTLLAPKTFSILRRTRGPTR
jgi:restriction system protein